MALLCPLNGSDLVTPLPFPSQTPEPLPACVSGESGIRPGTAQGFRIQSGVLLGSTSWGRGSDPTEAPGSILSYKGFGAPLSPSAARSCSPSLPCRVLSWAAHLHMFCPECIFLSTPALLSLSRPRGCVWGLSLPSAGTATSVRNLLQSGRDEHKGNQTHGRTPFQNMVKFLLPSLGLGVSNRVSFSS